MPVKPLNDLTEDELRDRLRAMYARGGYVSSPNDIHRELRHRQATRHARWSAIGSIVSATVATVAVVLSAIALVQGAVR
jgi:hypothetical protein